MITDNSIYITAAVGGPALLVQKNGNLCSARLGDISTLCDRAKAVIEIYEVLHLEHIYIHFSSPFMEEAINTLAPNIPTSTVGLEDGDLALGDRVDYIIHTYQG